MIDKSKFNNEERFYGRRKGRPLRLGVKNLINDFLPKITVTGNAGKIYLGDVFENSNNDLWLEIGFGAGEHLAWQAKNHTDVNIIGCEPYINGVARLLSSIRDDKLNNVRICPDDARPLMDALPDNCISRAFILFADPWPKTRHNNRRIINPENLTRLARILKTGAILRIASDHKDYICWIIRHLMNDDNFIWLDEGPSDWYHREDDWPATRYETKALAGRSHYLRFKKISNQNI